MTMIVVACSLSLRVLSCISNIAESRVIDGWLSSRQIQLAKQGTLELLLF